jgi:beta-ribofuranosylaminobenzene 5'-phosphate synthase
MTVFVEAPARLHFGMLDLSGTRGRRFGGVGAAVPAPSTLVSATPARSVAVEGVESAREGAARAAARVVEHYGVEGGAHVMVHRALPAHHGLGSGTQLALAVGRAVAASYGLSPPATELTEILRRGRRSAIGTHVFALGGCVLEGGRADGGDRPAPLLSRLPFPEQWRCVVAIPASRPGMSGDAEADAFALLPSPPERDAERVAHLVLMALWPALAEADFATFSAALGELQRINGEWFAAVQGGPFAVGASAPLIVALGSWGATGIGQSSWGPAVYALASDPDAAAALAQRVHAWLESHGGGAVYNEPFSATGARVWEE